MGPRLVRRAADAVRRTDRPIRISVDGEPVSGIDGQSLAGVLLASGRLSWRRGPDGAPRGLFCGIGVCFDCLVTVNGERDVRACLRRARDGAEVRTQSRAADGEGESIGASCAGVDAPATPSSGASGTSPIVPPRPPAESS